MKKFLPHIIAVVSFLIISMVYFSPVFDGKELLGEDLESSYTSSKEATTFKETHDEPALWTGSMFSGMPTTMIAGNRTFNVINLFNTPSWWFPVPIVCLFLYLIGFYILLISFRINPWLSLAGAIAFAFCSYNLIILAAGHITKARVIAFIAPLIGSIVFAFRRDKWIGMLLTTLFLALAIGASHVQVLYYTMILLLVFGVSELIYAIKEKRIKELFSTLGLLLVAVIIAVGLNAKSLWTTKEYSEYTMRGKSNGLSEQVDKDSHQEGLNNDYITQWSYGVGETMTLLIPSFNGGASQDKLPISSHTGKKVKEVVGGEVAAEQTLERMSFPLYWGTQPFTSGPVYVGAIICFLFMLGLILVEGKNKWWLLAGAILFMLLSWGKNFMPLTEFFIKYVPMYNMFRAVSMMLLVTTFCMAFLAVLGVDKLFSSKIPDEKKKKALYIAAGITGGLALIFALFPSLAGDFRATNDAMLTQYGYPDWITTTLPLDRKAMLSADAFRSFVFIALAFGLLWSYVSFKKIKTEWIAFALAALFLMDMVPIAKRYLNDDNFTEKRGEMLFSPTPADAEILKDKSHYRVLDMTYDPFNSSRPAYFHKLIGGYSAAKLRRYQEVINYHLVNEISAVRASFGAAQQAQSFEPINKTLEQNGVLNMLNMKYLIFNGGSQPIVNPFANGNVWFVDSIIIAETPDEEMIKLGEINTKTTLIADKEWTRVIPKTAEKDTAAHIELTEYSLNTMKYKSSATTDQVAVFSEIYYEKGWNVFIDGEQVPYFRANYLLRAMRIPAGNHEIEFRFEPQSFFWGKRIDAISSVIFVLLAAGILFFHYRKKKNKEVENS